MNPSSLVGHILQLMEHIDGENKSADHLTMEFFRAKKYLGSHDRRFISEAVFGMIRNRRLIKTLLQQFIKDNPGTADLEGPHVRYLSLYVAYLVTLDNHTMTPQILWNTYFPKIKVECFTDWILRHKTLDFIGNEEIARMGVKYSFPDWIVKEWVDQIGMETESLLQICNTQSNVSLRVNLLKTTREECQKRLREEGIETEVTKISPVGLISRKRFHSQSSASFNDGWYEMQDEGSQLISSIADPQPGEIVVDACAGSGGKSLHLAQLMKNSGEIIAVDVDKSRLAELRKRAKRAEANIIRIEHRTNLATDDLSDKVDLVLVDAPCSGVGTVRRNPWQKWNITESLVQHYTEKQKNILQFNSQFVKPGGKLVYATCSLFRQENEDIVKSFLSSHHEFILTSPEKILARLNLSLKDSTITIYPHHYNTDGFFIAVMKRAN